MGWITELATALPEWLIVVIVLALLVLAAVAGGAIYRLLDKRGGRFWKLEVNPPSSSPTTSMEGPEGAASPEPAGDDEAEAIDTDNLSFTDLLEALESRDDYKIDAIANHLRQQAGEHGKTLIDGALLYGRSRYRDDAGAFSKLQQLQKDNNQVPGLCVLLAWRYQEVGEHRKARDMFLLAAEIDGGAAKAYPIAMAGRMDALENGPDSALELLAKQAQSLDPEDRGIVLDAMHDVSRKNGRLEEAAYFLTAAISQNPGLSSKAFEVGYILHDTGAHAAADGAYDVYLQSRPNSAAALNNRGLVLAELGALATARSFLERSADQGNALAAANIAGRLVAGGFIPEARQWLERARDLDPKEARIGEVEGQIQAQRKSEGKKLEAASQEAKRFRDFGIHYAQAILAPSPRPDVAGATWKLPGEDEAAFSEEDGTLRLDYKSYKTPGDRLEFDGDQRAGRLTVFDREYNLQESKIEWKAKGSGHYVFLGDDVLWLSVRHKGKYGFETNPPVVVRLVRKEQDG